MKFIYPLLVVLLAVFAVAPLDYPGAFQSHTGLLAYYNLIDLDQNQAQIFTWAPTVGRAFDLFRSDGPLPYLIAEIVHWFGLDFLAAIKFVYALAWVASGLAMYALARRFFSQAGALLAATVYVYLPWHIATVYVRGAFAEAVAWALMPLAALVLVDRATNTKLRAQTFCFVLLTFTLFYLVQPDSAILFALVAGVLLAVYAWRSGSLRRWLVDVAAIPGGLVIGALLNLPAILRHGAAFSRDGFNANFVLPFQLFSSLWGWGASTGSFLDKFPLQLGIAPLELAIIAVALAWRPGTPANQSLRNLLLGSLITALVLTILTFEIAAPVWKVLGLFVTYPWQLLAFVGLLLAFAAGAVTECDVQFSRPAMLAFFVAVPIVAGYSYLAPRFLDFAPTRPYVTTFNNNEIALLDYRIVGPLRHGATVRLHLTWQALRPVDHDYTVFLHAVNDDGETYAQDDTKPQGGGSPTLKWVPGQVISDTHTIQINVDGPREGYHLELGLYVPATGRRALTNAGVDHVILPRAGDDEPTIVAPAQTYSP